MLIHIGFPLEILDWVYKLCGVKILQLSIDIPYPPSLEVKSQVLVSRGKSLQPNIPSYPSNVGNVGAPPASFQI
jgi:hypothetical protein